MGVVAGLHMLLASCFSLRSLALLEKWFVRMWYFLVVCSICSLLVFLVWYYYSHLDAFPVHLFQSSSSLASPSQLRLLHTLVDHLLSTPLSPHRGLTSLFPWSSSSLSCGLASYLGTPSYYSRSCVFFRFSLPRAYPHGSHSFLTHRLSSCLSPRVSSAHFTLLVDLPFGLMTLPRYGLKSNLFLGSFLSGSTTRICLSTSKSRTE